VKGKEGGGKRGKGEGAREWRGEGWGELASLL